MLPIPNSPENYKAFFKELAEKHVNIRLSDSRPNFTVINIMTQIKGFSDDDVRSFFNVVKNQKTKTDDENNCSFVLVEMSGDSDKGDLDTNKKSVVGSFFILSSPKDLKDETKDAVRNMCYLTGMDCLGVLKAFFETNATKGRLVALTDESCRIAGHNLVGWRFDFKYYLTGQPCFESTNFNNLMIPTI